MRRILVAAAIAAAACGSKPTIMATPEIKATASQAQLGMSSASTNTQASIGLQSIGSSVGDAAASGDVSAVDLSTGLPDPDQMAAAAVAPGAGGVQQALRLGGSSKSATIPTGCLRSQGGTATLIAAGTAGCTADTYLEVDYQTGDKAKVTWTDNTTSFDLKIEVIAGPWTGTNLHYTGNVTGSSSASVSVSGAMMFSRNGSVVHVNADFNITYAVSVSLGSNSTTVNINVNGTATDHIGLVRANEHWGLSMQDSTSGTTDTTVIHWNGGIGVDVLKQDGVTTDHSVAFNLNVNVTTTTSGTGTGTATWSAGGDVEYDGAVAGNIVSKNNQLYVDWTDGTEDAFDPSALLGPAGV
ncbi:MAG: hypothetical protein E6J82_05580 [Deltaproteobacteria bacterium]|nr:MAG: hypothetical protein E6J82_05580 [Deltaproteobacteria bacterium]TMA77156.1 MAG: hypothetical protein E6J67_03080 [Deltaproteobacteria bacterium]TMB33747.1 MAG: hypothetical protein E6J58_20180 [Deltaproteobacteria bacterium]